MDTNWRDFKEEILLALDIRAEYQALGVEFTKQTPSSKGWLECRAYGRQDRNPSAGVNITGDGERGRYKEFSGDGRSMSLFDFAISTGKFTEFRDCLRYYAERAGKSVPKGRPPDTAESQLKFADYNRDIVANWCRIKVPLVPQAVQLCGGRVATYDTRSRFGTFSVVAFPFYGPSLLDADPCGWAAYSVSGQEIPLPQGNSEPRMLKVITTKGSISGYVGRYGLSILDKAELVWKVEGITDMLAVQSMILRHYEQCPLCAGKGCGKCHSGKIFPYINKHAVITTSGGAAEFPSEKYTKPLAGKRVFVVHDQDEAGEVGTGKWFTELAKVASECRAIRLPFPFVENHGQDLRDYFNQGNNYAKLLSFANQPENIIYTSALGGEALAKPLVIKPVNEIRSSTDDIETLAEERRLCEILGIQVIGENDKMGIEIFSIRHGKTTMIPKISFLTIEELIQICGEQVAQYINQNQYQDVAGTYRMAQVKRAIAAMAGYQRANAESKSGLGCWRGVDAQGNLRNSVVVVGGHEGFEWNSDKQECQRIRQPIWGGLILDFKTDNSWYEYGDISNYINKASDEHWSMSVLEQAESVFKNWNWRYKKFTPKICVGLILASWVQTLWHWRPLAAVTGPSSAGKSTLFETLDSIFCGLGLLSSKSSEAGIRQTLANNASILLCDEFESDSQRQKILELFRTSTKGSKKLMGTTDQRGQSFGLRHICWVAAIETGIRKEPDRNRFVQLELKRLKKDVRGSMQWLPNSHELNDLGMKLLAVAIRNIHNALLIADQIRSYRKDAIDGRVIESYAILVSMLAAVQGNDVDVAHKLMEDILGEIEFDMSNNHDENDLLGDIFSSIVDCGGGVRVSVSQILGEPGKYSGIADDHLAKSGVARVTGKPAIGSRAAAEGVGQERYLFLVPNVVDRVLLRDTRWKGQDINQILRRIPNAEVADHRIASHKQRGVRVPWNYVSDLFLGDKDTPNDLTDHSKQQKLNYEDDEQ